MQDYPKKSSRCYFFAGLLFALILGVCGYWMLQKEQTLVENAAPRNPDIAILDARAKPTSIGQSRTSRQSWKNSPVTAAW
jgi:hypothetical protein